MAEARARATVVIGVGNSLRHDDAAGLEAVRRLRTRAERAGVVVCEQQGECLGLLAQWEGAGAVVLIDAIHSGRAPGTIDRLDASAMALPAELVGSSSTHAVGIGEAIELARALDRLPARVVVFGVEGRCFSAGEGLSEQVRAAIPALADAAGEEALRLAGRSATG